MKELLDTWQIEAAEKLTTSMGGLCWAKVGEGKTRVALYWQQLMSVKMDWQPAMITLVVCRRKAFLDWREEINRCLPNVLVYEDECPVAPPRASYLLVSDGMFCKLAKSGYLSERRIRCTIYDEGWLYANHKSAKSRAIQFFSVGRRALLLSGTVMKAKNTLEVYSQAMAVYKHKLIAGTPTKFLGEFQTRISLGNFPKYYPKKGAYHKLMQRITPAAVLHFPEGHRRIHDQYHTVEPTTQQLKYFKELKENYALEDHGLVFNNALAIGIKAQQISNGWIQDANGNIQTIPTNKISKLTEEIEAIILDGTKVIVWCAFREDVKQLAKTLPFATVQMVGGTAFDMARWRDPSVSVCLATVGSGSSVNHFAQVPYAIYFSSDYKWLNMQQSRGRTERNNSKHNDCYYKYLQVGSSLDAKIFKAVMDSSSQEDLLIKFGEAVTTWIKH